MKTALVVTSISAPNPVLQSLAEGAVKHKWDFIVAGDTKSPESFDLDGCRFLSISAQEQSRHSLGKICPTASYTRKNIAYLEAIRSGAEVIVETDDDNFPRDSFWNPRQRQMKCRDVIYDGWINAYSYFSESFIYPRGLPLGHARKTPPGPGSLRLMDCPLQQGLADANPDVDAIYRMLFPLPFNFEQGIEPIALRDGAWCPFNSQNTTFFEEIFPLLYLPAHCSFRMTDIWRSFVAQRILHELDFPIIFHSATVWQERNDHSLHQDFCDEVPGYKYNDQMRAALLSLDLSRSSNIPQMMEVCYQRLIREKWVGKDEELLLSAWIDDLNLCMTEGR